MIELKKLFKLNRGLIKTVLATIILGTALSIGLSFVRAYSPPTTPPPGGNISAPINIGPATQTKSGALTLGGALTANSVITANGGIFSNGIIITNNNSLSTNGITANSITLGGITKTSWPSEVPSGYCILPAPGTTSCPAGWSTQQIPLLSHNHTYRNADYSCGGSYTACGVTSASSGQQFMCCK